jgi:hypothetical protein
LASEKQFYWGIYFWYEVSGNQYQQYKNIYIITIVAPIFVRVNFRGFVEKWHVHRHWISNLIKKTPLAACFLVYDFLLKNSIAIDNGGRYQIEPNWIIIFHKTFGIRKTVLLCDSKRSGSIFMIRNTYSHAVIKENAYFPGLSIFYSPLVFSNVYLLVQIIAKGYLFPNDILFFDYSVGVSVSYHKNRSWPFAITQ